MEITFGLNLDGAVFRGALRPGEALVGSVAVGPAGLARLLALHLGIPTPVSLTSRSVALVRPMLAQSEFWARSASADPVGTAETLLRWRDDLIWAGWRGQPVSRRLDAVFALTSSAPPGSADVAVKAVDLLSERRLGWSVSTVDQENAGLLARLLGTLGAKRSSAQPTAVVRASEVLVVEPTSLVDASEIGAAWLDQEGSRLVVGREPLLDHALARAGHPTLGQRQATTDDPALAVLAAVVALAFDTDHPALAQRFLRLPQIPIHGHYRARLLAALSSWPSTTSPAWRDALMRADDKLTDVERAPSRAVLNNIFDPSFGVNARIALVEHWAGERVGATASSSTWARVVEQCRHFRRLLSMVGVPLRPHDVLRLLDTATEDVGGAPIYGAEAGIAHVAHPGCVLGDVERLLWWAAPDGVTTTPRLTRVERDLLRGHGVSLPDAKALARRHAASWARALSSPTVGLLLIAPTIDGQGNPAPRSPIVDEILRHADVVASRALLSAERGQRPPVVRPTPHPRERWTVPAGRVQLREVESPNSVATLLGCSLRWALRYSTSTSTPSDGALPCGPLLFGRLAHELLHGVLERQSDGALLADEAGKLFDAEAPRLAATLFLPGVDAERAAVRGIVVDAARLIGHFMQDLGLRVQSTEQPFSKDAEWLGGRFEGRPDLVLGPRPLLVLDFKWSLGHHRDAMLAGTAHQLASYSFLVGDAAAKVDVGYLVLRLRQIFSTAELPSRGARQLTGPSPAATFEALRLSARRASAKLLEGSLEAPGASGREAGADCLDKDGLAVAPPCAFCEYGVLCGRNVGRDGV